MSPMDRIVWRCCGRRSQSRYSKATRFFAALTVAISVAWLGCDTATGITYDGTPLLQTESLEYELRSDGIGLSAEIPYVFTNRTGRPVYIVNCRGYFLLHLEKEVDGEWTFAWGPGVNACLSDPIVVEANETFIDTISVWGTPPDRINTGPNFHVDDPDGVYRIVWDDALSSFTEDAPPVQDDVFSPFGPQIPLEWRISNRFTLRR